MAQIAGDWEGSSGVNINVNLTDGQTHDVTLYILDWLERGVNKALVLTNATTGPPGHRDNPAGR